MQSLIDTTFAGKDISSAVSVYEYTVPANGTYRFQVRLAAVAGDGDYVAYLTLNDDDAQSDDIIEPRTTVTLDAGQTTCWFTSIGVDALAGDVINIFLEGLAGDTNESGSIRVFRINYVPITTYGNTLDVNATGGAEVGSMQTNTLTADALATDAVAEISTAIRDLVIEGTLTLRYVLRIALAALAGKSSGGGTTSIAFRDQADTKDRIDATVDSSGNRTSITVDGS